MYARLRSMAIATPCRIGLTLLALLRVPLPSWAQQQTTAVVSAVGGVMVDAKGVLSNAEVDDYGRLRQLRQQAMKELPGDIKQPTRLRKVSLRGLEAAIAQHLRKSDSPRLPDELYYLAGLTRIQYVLVYPEQNDIVLAGPAEGWKVDAKGSVVGVETGMPILQLDHLLVALRTASSAAQNPISCSIDPTEAGLRRFQTFIGSQKQFGPGTRAGVEQSLGMQTITITGVPDSSDFARIMVAADYRMKRIAMGFDKSPVKGLPSYLEMVAGKSSGQMPRWWLAPNYDAMLKDPEGLVWELRGPGVKALTEDAVFAADGTRQLTGKSSPQAQKWADLLTDRYTALCVAEPIFGELRNIMDMAVVSALIVKEGLSERAECPLSMLLSEADLPAQGYPTPKHVHTQVSALKKGNSWIISASGGVQVSSWEVADKVETGPALAPLHKTAQQTANGRWYWD